MNETVFSIVIPCYNSSKSIKEVVSLTITELEKIDIVNYEFILVNDCSPDDKKTLGVLRELASAYPQVKVIDLAKNTGQHAATVTGLRYAKGDYIISMDDDLQTHPSQIYKIINHLLEGDYDIVYGYYPKKKHSFLRNIFSRMNYVSVRFLIGKPKDLETSSFWIIRKFVKDYIIQYQSSFPYLQGLFLRTTRNISSIPVQHFERQYGESNYTFKKLFGLWSNILGFSIRPLRISIYLGVLCSMLGFLSTLTIIIWKLCVPSSAVGWASIMSAICFFSGIILLFLGLVGEYIGRIYLASNKEPQVVIRETLNMKRD